MAEPKRNDALFNLIKALTQSEKRYFKRFSTIQVSEKKPSFLVLFEIIEKVSENDENKIKAQFFKKTDSKNFNETKYYLYNLILKALHNFNYDSDIAYNLQNQLIFAKILYDKNLISDSRITSSKIIEQGEQYNDYVVVFQAAFLNLMAKFHQYDQQDSIDESMNNYKIMMESLENLEYEVRFHLEYYKQFVSYKYNHLVIDEKHRSSFDKLINSEFINKTDPNKMSKLAKAYNYNIKTLLQLKDKNNEGALQEMTEYLNFCENNHQFKKRHIKSYISLLNNYAFTLRLNGKLKESADSFLKLRKYIFDVFKNKAENFIFYITISCIEEVKIYLQLENIQMARKRANEVEGSYLIPLSLSKGYELEFIFVNAYCYHLESNHKKCIYWLGKLFLEKCEHVFKQPVLLESFLLFITTQWLIGNKELILSLFNKNELLLSNYLINKNYNEVKRIVTELSKTDSKHTLKKYFKENPPDFIELEDKEKGVNFNFSQWINSI